MEAVSIFQSFDDYVTSVGICTIFPLIYIYSLLGINSMTARYEQLKGRERIKENQHDRGI